MTQAAFAADAAETVRLAAQIAAFITPGTCLALHGDLGAGKTTVATAISAVFGYFEVSSPTFAYMNIYQGTLFPIYHMDLYRLEKLDAVEQLELDEYFISDGLCLIEWPENAGFLIPDAAWHLFISPKDDGRLLTLRSPLPLLPGWEPVP